MSTGGGVAGVGSTGTTDNGSVVAEPDSGTVHNSGGSKCGQLSLTPRFTQEEKEILYSLFHQHEEVIDIKFRKKQRSKYSVRDAWEQIVREFNSHPGVSAVRNLKQIQKFWLNARLRKQYPFRTHSQKASGGRDSIGDGAGVQQQMDGHSHTIKDEPEFQLNAGETPEHQAAENESFDEMEMDANGVTQLEDEAMEEQEQEQEQHQQQQQQQQQHHHHQQQLQQHVGTIQAQQINVDQISPDKLTLNDLLQFKTTRPRDQEIILQIKHPADATGAQITIPSPTRISIPTHHHQQQQQHPQQHTMATITASGYNQQIISEIKPQQITLAQYQAQQQLQQQQLVQQQQLAQQQVALQQQHAAQQQQQQQQVKLQLQSPVTPQFATVTAASVTPTFTCTTYGALPPTTTATMPTIVSAAPAAVAPTPAATVAAESFEEKYNYLKLKEAELRCKELQVRVDANKIQLNRAQDELKHLREIHRLQVEELKAKIRVLQMQEKQLRNQSLHTSSDVQP